MLGCGSELAEYNRFIRSLPTSDKLEPGHIFGGFPRVTGENALAFVTHWLQQRPCFRTSMTLLHLFEDMTIHGAGEDVASPSGLRLQVVSFL